MMENSERMGDSQNIIAEFFDTVGRRGDAVCAHFKRDGRWESVSWREMAGRVKGVAAGLRKMGLRKGDRVIILSRTRLEWTIADCGVMAAGGVSVPVYPSITAERIADILADSHPIIAIVEDVLLAEKFGEAMRASGRAIPVISIEEGVSGAVSSLASIGGDAEIVEIDRIVSGEIGSADIATIVYTSGTMGEQKGVVLTHDNIFTEVSGARRVVDFGPEEIGFVCLPLAHVLGRLLQFYQLAQGCESAYAESIEKLAQNYEEIKPHFVCGVPRMLDKIHEIVELRVARSSWPKRKIFEWAVGVGLEYSGFIQKHRKISLFLKARRFFADRFVFRHIRAKLGGRMRCFISGGAPLSEDIAKFFHAAGLLVLEGYGLTETFAAATVNRPNDYHFGTVGKPLPGVEVKISLEGDVLIRGRTVFRGYLNRPDETRSAFDAEGWFITGDMGEYSRDGFLRITGRRKDIIVTSGGKNIAPQMIEELMSKSPYVNHFMVYGDGRKYLTGLVTLNVGAVIDYLGEQGCAVVEGESLARNPVVAKLIGQHVEEQNRRLAPYETIKKIAIVDDEFSVATGELTPTLKVRRAFTSEKYRGVLEALYRD